jgi:hypothetical protein
MVRVFSCAAAGLILAAATAVSAEDLTIVSNFTAGKGGGSTSTQYMTSDKLRTSDGQTDSIVDFASGKITMIDHKKKQYSEMTAEEISAAFEKMNAQMKQMEEQMKNAPAFLKKTMGGGAAEVKVAKGGASKKIAGYDCDHYVATMGDTNKMEFWVTKAIKPPVQYYDAFKIQMSAMGPAGQTLGKAYEEMKKIDGYPLASSTTFKMMGMTLNSSSEATEVKKGPVPASAFDIPSGYKKGKSPLAK